MMNFYQHSVPVQFHPGMPPAPPPPPPPSPVRHPDLFRDIDTYSRREVDSIVDAMLAAAKAYTDEKIAEAISGLSNG